jgi:hypothetical protein
MNRKGSKGGAGSAFRPSQSDPARSVPMPNLAISIPHPLTRPEAKRRIQDHIRDVEQKFGNVLGELHHRWSDDTLDFMLVAGGQSVSGQVFVEDHLVRVEVALPWMFALLANAVKQNVENEARLLLGPP